MIDNLDALEKKVSLLIEKLEKAKEIIVKLDKDKKDMKAQYAKELTDSNERIKELERQIKDFSTKSDKVKDRIDSVLQKINFIETTLLSEEKPQDS